MYVREPFTAHVLHMIVLCHHLCFNLFYYVNYINNGHSLILYIQVYVIVLYICL